MSVCMITYNHAPYVAEAIEGVMMQKCDFSFELIIGEDCSTDDTRAIVISYKEKYPDKIRLLLREKNVGVQKNFIDTMQATTGKYIALCEGDDYWIDSCKLQKQVDFLERNVDFSICFHSVKIYKQQENVYVDDFITREVPNETTIYDLMKGNYIHTPSVVFRKNNIVFEQLDQLGKIMPSDFALHLLNAKYGKIKKINEEMAVYRYGVGIWSPFSNEWSMNKACLAFSFYLKQSVVQDDEVKQYFSDKSDEIMNNIIYRYECSQKVYQSKAYRLGKFLLKPFVCIKKRFMLWL